MHSIDILDKQILIELEQNARVSVLELARKLGAPNSTVRDRIRKLEESGIIKGYAAQIDYIKLGYGIKAIVQVTRESAIPLERTLTDIENVPEIQKIQFVTGDIDELVTLYLRDIGHLKDVIFSKLSRLSWKSKLNTLIVMDEKSFPITKGLIENEVVRNNNSQN